MKIEIIKIPHEEGGVIGKIESNSLVHADCLDAMKHIESKSIDMILCDYASGLSLRSVATKNNTNHHRVKRILMANGISIRQPKNTRALRKYETLLHRSMLT